VIFLNRMKIEKNMERLLDDGSQARPGHAYAYLFSLNVLILDFDPVSK
jgi:hypothetical protein